MQIDYEYLSRIRRAVALYTNKKTSNILDGDFHSIHRGRSMEFDDLKEYTFGDDVHDIDWKSSSRMGSILVRRYMTDRRHNVMFICDCGEKMLGDTTTGEPKKELALMLFGTIAYITGRNGADYGMAYAKGSKPSVSMFRSGPEHLEKLLYEYEANVCNESTATLGQVLNEVVGSINKRMILFIITDSAGIESLDANMLRAITKDHDLLIYNIEDAMLTGDYVFDNVAKHYEKFFLSHDKALHEEELRIRKETLERASEMCKQCKIGLTSISATKDIIDRTIDLLERYKHGYYGYSAASI
jgi:uncharacterized protein (DUF58 family)